METYGVEKVQIQRLDKLIEELRDILNEICNSSEGVENAKEKLIISQCLDQLIVEYMSR